MQSAKSCTSSRTKYFGTQTNTIETSGIQWPKYTMPLHGMAWHSSNTAVDTQNGQTWTHSKRREKKFKT